MNPPCFRLLLLTTAGILIFASCRRHDEGSAQPTDSPPLSVALSTNVVWVGDIFRMTLTAVHPKTDTLTVPEIAQGKDIIVRNHQIRKQPLTGDRVRTTLNYDLMSFVVGEHTISTGTVQFVHSDGTTTAVPFPTAKFDVRSILTGANTPWRDIKGLARWPGVFPRWLTGLLLIAALAAIAAMAVHRFLTKPRVILQYPPPLEPHQVALNALRDLLAKGWIESENAEPFYIELSSIIRRYLEDRFGLRAPERTTEEFIREATTSRSLSPDHQILTSEFLEQCDLVKFARHRPARKDMQNGYAAAERLVRETIPTPPTSTTDHRPPTLSP
jgi:hypothetical protein